MNKSVYRIRSNSFAKFANKFIWTIKQENLVFSCRVFFLFVNRPGQKLNHLLREKQIKTLINKENQTVFGYFFK